MDEVSYGVKELSTTALRKMYGNISKAYNISTDCTCGICDCACFGGGGGIPLRQVSNLEKLTN